MKKFIKISMQVFFSMALILPVFQTELFTQEQIVDREKLFKEIAGDYEYFHEGQAILISYFIENGALMGQQEGDMDIVELFPVEGKELEFEVNDEDGQTFEVYFYRDDKGKIAKSIIKTEGITAEGNKIKD